MSLTSSFLGHIEVYEEKGFIYVSGFRSSHFVGDVQKHFGTKTVTHLFVSKTRYGFRVPRFFGIELYYILDQLKNLKRRINYWSDIQPGTYRKIQDLLAEKTWVGGTVNLPEEKPLPKHVYGMFTKTPFDYQEAFMKHYLRVKDPFQLNGYMLGAEPGTGKTFTLAFLSQIVDSKVKIIISPKNAIYRVWEECMLNDFKAPPKYWIADRESKLDLNAEYYIFHYETLDRAIELVKRLGKTSYFIGLDESHNFNERKSARTEKFLELCELSGSKDVILSSGTPLKALGREAITMIKAIIPDFTPKSEEMFIKIFGLSRNTATDMLAHRLGHIVFKVSADVGGRPLPIEEDLQIQLKNGEDYTLDTVRREMRDFVLERLKYYTTNFDKYEKIYNAAVAKYEATIRTPKERERLNLYKSYVEIIRKGYDPVAHKEMGMFANAFEKNEIGSLLKGQELKDFRSAKSVVKYVQLKVQGEALGRILGGKRSQCFADMATAIDYKTLLTNSEKKVVVFSSYIATVDKLYDHLEKLKIPAIRVHSQTGIPLTTGVQEFFKDDSKRILLTTYDSLSTAVPLIVANTMLMIDQPYRDYIRKQTIARIDRQGQTSQTYIFKAFLDTGESPNISTRSNDILEWSREQVNLLLGLDKDTGTAALEDCYDMIPGFFSEASDSLNVKNQKGNITMRHKKFSLAFENLEQENDLSTENTDDEVQDVENIETVVAVGEDAQAQLDKITDYLEEKVESGEELSEDAAEVLEIALEGVYDTLGLAAKMGDRYSPKNTMKKKGMAAAVESLKEDSAAVAARLEEIRASRK